MIPRRASKGLFDVVAGRSEFVHNLFGMVMAARFEVQLDNAIGLWVESIQAFSKSQ